MCVTFPCTPLLNSMLTSTNGAHLYGRDHQNIHIHECEWTVFGSVWNANNWLRLQNWCAHPPTFFKELLTPVMGIPSKFSSDHVHMHSALWQCLKTH